MFWIHTFGMSSKDLVWGNEAAQRAIMANPTTYQIRYKNKVRAFVVNRFPYLILYIVAADNIDVISVFNTHQHPKWWKKRLKLFA